MTRRGLFVLLLVAGLMTGAVALSPTFTVTSPRTSKAFTITVNFTDGINDTATVTTAAFTTVYTDATWPQTGAGPCTAIVGAPTGTAYPVDLTCTAGKVTFALVAATIKNPDASVDYTGSVDVDFTPALSRSSTSVAHDGYNPISVVYDYVFNVNSSTFTTATYTVTEGTVVTVVALDNTVTVDIIPSGTETMTISPDSDTFGYEAIGPWPTSPVLSSATTTALAFEYAVPLVTVSSPNPGMHSGAGALITINITINVEIADIANLTSADFVGSGYSTVADTLLQTQAPDTRFWGVQISVTGTDTVRFGIRAGAVSSKTTGFQNGASNQLAFVYTLQDGLIRPVDITPTAALGATPVGYSAVSISGGVSSRGATLEAYVFADVIALKFERIANPAIPTIAIAEHTVVLTFTSTETTQIKFRVSAGSADLTTTTLTWVGSALGSQTVYVKRLDYSTGITECTTGGTFEVLVDVTAVNGVDVSSAHPSTYFEAGVTKLVVTRGPIAVPAVTLLPYDDLVTYFSLDDAPSNPATAVFAQAANNYKLFAFYRPCSAALEGATGDRTTFWPENTTLLLSDTVADIGGTTSADASLEAGISGWDATHVTNALLASCLSCAGVWPSPTLAAGIFNWTRVIGSDSIPSIDALSNRSTVLLPDIGRLSWTGGECGDESLRFVPYILFPGLDTAIAHEVHGRVSITAAGEGVAYAAAPATSCTLPAYTATGGGAPVMKAMNAATYAPTTLDTVIDAVPVDTRVYFGAPTLVGDNEIEFTVSLVIPSDASNVRRALNVISIGTACLTPTVDGSANMIRFPAATLNAGTCMNVPPGYEAAVLDPAAVVEDTAVEDLWHSIFTVGMYPSETELSTATDSGTTFTGDSNPFFPVTSVAGVVTTGFKVVTIPAEEGSGRKAVYTLRGTLDDYLACVDMLGTSVVVPINDVADGKITYNIPVTVQRFVAGDTVAKTTLSHQCVHHTMSVTVVNGIVQILSAYAQGLTLLPAIRSIEPEVCTVCNAVSGTGTPPLGYACPGPADAIYWRLRVVFSLTLSSTASSSGGDTGPLDTYLVPFVAAPSLPSGYTDLTADQSSIVYSTEGESTTENVFLGVLRSVCVNTHDGTNNDRNAFRGSTNFNVGIKLQQLRAPNTRWSSGLSGGVTDLTKYNLYGTADVHLTVQYADGLPTGITAASTAFMAHELSMWPDPEYKDATTGNWRQKSGSEAMVTEDRLDAAGRKVNLDMGASVVLIHKLTNTAAAAAMQLHNREILVCTLQPASPYYACIAGEGGGVTQKTCPTGNDAWLGLSCNKADWNAWIDTTAGPGDLSPVDSVYSFLREYSPTTPITGAPATLPCRYDLKSLGAKAVAGTRTFFCETYNPTTQLVSTLRYCGITSGGTLQHTNWVDGSPVTQWQLLPIFAAEQVAGADATEISFIGLPISTQYYISVSSTAYDCRLGIGGGARLLLKYEPDVDSEPRYLRSSISRHLATSDTIGRNDVSAGIAFTYGAGHDNATWSLGLIMALSVVGLCAVFILAHICLKWRALGKST